MRPSYKKRASQSVCSGVSNRKSERNLYLFIYFPEPERNHNPNRAFNIEPDSERSFQPMFRLPVHW